jgi:hypothetical protein
MRAILCGVVCLLTTNPVVAQERPEEKATPSPWVIGNTAPPAGAIFEAWLDRALLDPKNPKLDAAVTVGSPSDMSVWLRTGKETCATSEAAARRTTKADDGRLLYVCARPRSSGKFVLTASASGAPIVVSDAIEVTARRTFSPTATAVFTTLLTTIVGFFVGLLTSYVHGRMQHAREEETLRKTVDTTLSKVLSSEMLENKQILDRVAQGGDPEILKTAAYNNADALGPLVWGFLDSAKAASYRSRIDTYYQTKIKPYQDAVRAWNTAEQADKDLRRAEAKRQAEALIAASRS